MKKWLLIFCVFTSVTFTLTAQDAKDILKKSYDKCQSIKNGYYEITEYMKYLTENDTVQNSFNCYFAKLDTDTLYKMRFHYKQFDKTKYVGDVMYTGDEQVRTNVKDSTAIVMSKERWAKEIKMYLHNNTFYEPFTTKKSSPLFSVINFTDTTYSYKYIGTEILNNVDCYHIQVIENPVEEKGMVVLKKAKYDFWISTSKFIPMQHSSALDVVMNKQDMHQYKQHTLFKYEINNLEDDAVFTLKSIPSLYKFKEYLPYKAPELLSIHAIAPTWELTSLNGEKVNLESLKGKPVLIDFFYKNCGPCLMALPGLQSLHEKYKNKIHVIGIDPFDKEESVLKEFLEKRGITYTILINGQDVATTYNVSGYPTLYLVDKTGKIIHVKTGYSENFEIELENIIKKAL